MCFAKRLGTENVSGNDCSSRSRASNEQRMTTMRIVQLPGDHSALIPPLAQAVPAALGDAVEARGQLADAVERQPGSSANCGASSPISSQLAL